MKEGVIFFAILIFTSCGKDTGKKTNLAELQPQPTKELASFKFKSADFETFYGRFISDSLFQMNRIQFPLEGKYQGYGNEKEWAKENWPLISWDFREVMNSSDDSISIQQNDTTFFFGTYCKDCGFSFEMEFEQFDEDWYLTYRQENNY